MAHVGSINPTTGRKRPNFMYILKQGPFRDEVTFSDFSKGGLMVAYPLGGA